MADDDLPLHIHFGLGALGAGLVLAQHDPSRMDLVVVGRSSAAALSAAVESTGELEVALDGETRRIVVPELVRGDTDAGRQRLSELVGQDRPLLVTTTVKDGQAKIIDLLEELLVIRRERTDAGTTVVPCENALEPRWEEIRASRLAVVARHVLVDRICVLPEGEIVTRAEAYLEWKAGFDEGADGSLLEAAGGRVSDDIVFEKRRKVLLVNGVQFSAAVLCLRDDQEELDAYLATATGDLALRSLLVEYSLVLASEFNDAHHPIEDILDHSQVVGRRIAAMPDEAMRLIAGKANGRFEWMVAVAKKLGPRMEDPLFKLCQVLGVERLSATTMGKARIALDQLIRRLMDLDD
jgi:hypothetical protein